ncbi:hypothetical protein BXZ70DRAFT_1007509 [Cristinia sonorae]|uniref:Uncharacterized protein n=1 Tax=Cristinia sonorae TaxID=1940300 RepID=A0A8K0UPH5_9AGAR|nr:hypothetical protein BXZ70DRAFT_1007509 [Cristinia sonorae]
MSSPQLPNPETVLAWLPPETATHLQNSRYISTIVVGAWGWDVLTALHEEYTIFRPKVRFPDVCYMIARVGFQCNCQAAVVAIGIFGCLSISSNCLLFLFRIYALFPQRYPVLCAFTLCWLGVLGSSVPAPLSLTGVHIGTTSYCIFGRVQKFGGAGEVAAAINDTLVFLAVATRLSSNLPAATWRARLRLFFSGQGLGTISKTVLHGGQQYYLATVGFNIVSAIMILTPSVPLAYGNVMALPNVALQNAMASRVYRRLKIEYLKSLSSSSRRVDSDGKSYSHRVPSRPIEFEWGDSEEAGTRSSRWSRSGSGSGLGRKEGAVVLEMREDVDDERVGGGRDVEEGGWKVNGNGNGNGVKSQTAV